MPFNGQIKVGIVKRKNISAKIQFAVWGRDNWHCRYCGQPLFFAPTLKLLEKLNPNHSYYHPNGKQGKILPLFQWAWASIDHITPFSKGGANQKENYVSACWKCNLKYNNKITGKDKPKKIIESNWDGFSKLYPILQRNLDKKQDKWTKILDNFT
jgi:hypothetical protein